MAVFFLLPCKNDLSSVYAKDTCTLDKSHITRYKKHTAMFNWLVVNGHPLVDFPPRRSGYPSKLSAYNSGAAVSGDPGPFSNSVFVKAPQ